MGGHCGEKREDAREAEGLVTFLIPMVLRDVSESEIYESSLLLREGGALSGKGMGVDVNPAFTGGLGAVQSQLRELNRGSPVPRLRCESKDSLIGSWGFLLEKQTKKVPSSCQGAPF